MDVTLIYSACFGGGWADAVRLGTMLGVATVALDATLARVRELTGLAPFGRARVVRIGRGAGRRRLPDAAA